ncbi:MAG: hypothetical protein DWQ54_02240 [Microcystis flos-aquae TF09]|uniref:Uncharacterized protein n=1 Tax=Microcystis flos-aquae TF09 TaxID=2060473 RepID=A0A3E0LB93_9CHRO|nr:MAG: hypothetical protein DWQ54_02240 [Microcystis flos-aquae TF09]
MGNSRQPNRQDQRTATHCLHHRTLTHSCNQSAWCVPQKSITGAVGTTLGNAPYGDLFYQHSRLFIPLETNRTVTFH